MIYRCKGCGTTDSIVEISLVPSVQEVRPDPAPNAVPFEDVDYGSHENFYEGAPVIGYGCSNYDCEFWQGHWGYPRALEDGERTKQHTSVFGLAPSLMAIAEEVDA